MFLGAQRPGADPFLVQGFDDAFGGRRGGTADRAPIHQPAHRLVDVQPHDQARGALAGGPAVGQQRAVQLRVAGSRAHPKPRAHDVDAQLQAARLLHQADQHRQRQHVVGARHRRAAQKRRRIGATVDLDHRHRLVAGGAHPIHGTAVADVDRRPHRGGVAAPPHPARPRRDPGGHVAAMHRHHQQHQRRHRDHARRPPAEPVGRQRGERGDPDHLGGRPANPKPASTVTVRAFTTSSAGSRRSPAITPATSTTAPAAQQRHVAGPQIRSRRRRRHVQRRGQMLGGLGVAGGDVERQRGHRIDHPVADLVVHRVRRVVSGLHDAPNHLVRGQIRELGPHQRGHPRDVGRREAGAPEPVTGAGVLAR